ncbi:DUF5777 family beta-barrel protein [Flagellimonas sp. 2504JD4-2]
MKKIKKLFILLAVLPQFVCGQDLLEEIDVETSENFETAAFKGLKVVNFESTKMVSERELYFVVSHRFGSIKTGIEDFFGLDQAVTRLNLIYGITDGINASISRSSFQKTYEGALKLRLIRQKKGSFPLTIVWHNSAQINTSLDEDNLPGLEFKHKLGYATQLLVSRKVNEELSLQLAPTFFHNNLVSVAEQDNSQYALGIGGRHKLTKRWSINMDYGIHFNRADTSPFRNPLSIGFDLETGGHVFQLHFTNAQPMNINNFLGQATGDWSEGDIFFGFNISRVF